MCQMAIYPTLCPSMSPLSLCLFYHLSLSLYPCPLFASSSIPRISSLHATCMHPLRSESKRVNASDGVSNSGSSGSSGFLATATARPATSTRQDRKEESGREQTAARTGLAEDTLRGAGFLPSLIRGQVFRRSCDGMRGGTRAVIYSLCVCIGLIV